ncbi:MAG TPA: hypothetical protein VNU49_05620 [Opitutaceae bacterium]|jgi:hypothetical protein|nr:hypothetical protein [Opitutaceae bacterium]
MAAVLHPVANRENNEARENNHGHDYGDDRKEKYHYGSSGGYMHGFWRLDFNVGR